MGWVQEQIESRTEISGNVLPEPATPNGGSRSPRSRELEAWDRLLQGFAQDIEEFQRLGGDCTLELGAELQCRISNPSACIAAVVTADLSARTIEYSYESAQEKTAVPEKGILTLRPSDNAMDLYSADQRFSSEQTRRLVLEPLLFPTLPSGPKGR